MKARRRRKMAAYEYSLEKNFHFNLLLSFLWMSRDSLVAVLSRYLKGHRHSFGVNARAPSLASGAASALVSELVVGGLRGRKGVVDFQEAANGQHVLTRARE
jgi:hypothetical protein